MIESTKLLNMIQDYIKIWEFIDICITREEAVKRAAQIFMNYDGVRVKQRLNSWIVEAWTYKRRTER